MDAGKAWKNYFRDLSHYAETQQDLQAYGAYDDGKKPGYLFVAFDQDYVKAQVKPKEPDVPMPKFSVWTDDDRYLP
jgi:hypothetical protein